MFKAGLTFISSVSNNRHMLICALKRLLVAVIVLFVQTSHKEILPKVISV